MTLKNKKHQEFVNEYFLHNMNGTDAYQAVYPKATRESARREASRLLTNVDVKAEIETRLKEKQMSADEVLARLGDMAKSNIADFAHVENWSTLKKLKGQSHVIKKFKRKVTTGKDDTRYEEIELELYDAQAALVHIGRVHNLFKETHTNLNYDLSKATDEQLQRIRDGDDPAAVLANPTPSGG
jgi:phage terminase small subunit